MPTETLNIDYHTKRLILKALNQEKTVGAAAKVLGISERNLFFKMKEYGIKRTSVYVITGKFEIVNRL